MTRPEPTANWEPAAERQVSRPLLGVDSARQSTDSSTIALRAVTRPAHSTSGTTDLDTSSNKATDTKDAFNTDQSTPRTWIKGTDSGGGSQETARTQKRNILSIWLDEILMLLLAIGLLVAIILILNSFHHKKQPDWGGKITLNALIAVLATIFRASLAFVAFEIIGQVKWDWISRQPRSLHDIQLFDNASRGVPGTLRLLGLVLFRLPLAMVAIFVAVVSLGVGSFTQQAIQTYPCQQISNSSMNASVTTANIINSSHILTGTRSGFYQFNNTWKLAMQDAIINPNVDQNLPSELFNCPTGDCTFPTYGNTSDDEAISHASLGLCNSCANVYDMAKKPWTEIMGFPITKMSLPAPAVYGNQTEIELYTGNAYYNRHMIVRPVRNLTWAGKYIPKDMLNRERYAVAKFAAFMISEADCDKLANGTLTCPSSNSRINYVAASCIIYPCMKYYTGRVKNNVFSETTVRNVPLRPQTPKRFNSARDDEIWNEWSAVQQPCMVNGTLYTSGNMSEAEKLEKSSTQKVMAVSKDFENESPTEKAEYTNITAPNECIATFDYNMIRGIEFAFREELNSTCDVDVRSGNYMSCTTWYLAALMRGSKTTYDDIEDTINSITMRLTSQVRRAGIGLYNSKATTTSGQAWQTDICINVAWEWISFPAALCLACIILLAATVVRTALQKGRPVWKSSVLPLLLRDHPHIDAMEISEIEKTSKGFMIKWENGGKGSIEMMPQAHRGMS